MKKLTNIIEGLFDVEDTIEDVDNRDEVKNWFVNTLKTFFIAEIDGVMYFQGRGVHKNQFTQRAIDSCPVKHIDTIAIDQNLDIICPKFDTSFCDNIYSKNVTVANCHIDGILFDGLFTNYSKRLQQINMEVTFINCKVTNCEFKNLGCLNFDEDTRFDGCIFETKRPVVHIKINKNKLGIAPYLSSIFGENVRYDSSGVLRVPSDVLLKHFGIDDIHDYDGEIIFKELKKIISIRPHGGDTVYNFENAARYEGTIRNKFKLN